MKDGALWEAIKPGEINSFSFDATIQKELSETELPAYPSVVIGTTYGQLSGSQPTPTHITLNLMKKVAWSLGRPA